MSRLDVQPLRGDSGDYDPLLELIGDARVVLIGEASHGTHEFYRERALITRRLIEERDFEAVAVEADWPDAYRVNRYVRGAPENADAEEALRGFRRFPTWMWRNAEVLDRRHGSARLTVNVAGVGRLDVGGAGIKAVHRVAKGAGEVVLPVAPTGQTWAALAKGRAVVKVLATYTSTTPGPAASASRSRRITLKIDR